MEIDNFVKVLEACTQNVFDILIRASFFGGLKKWPVSEHLLECFSTGGFPIGWVGRKNGKSEKCMQLLHLGPTM